MKKAIKITALSLVFAMGSFGLSAFATEPGGDPCSKDGCTTRPGHNNGKCVTSAGGTKWCCIALSGGEVADCFSGS